MCPLRAVPESPITSRPNLSTAPPSLSPLLPPEELPDWSPINPEREDCTVPILLGTPTLGTIRMEWHDAMISLIAPPMWSLVRSTPKGFSTHDAQNMLVDTVLRHPFKFLILIEDDTIPHPGFLLAIDKHCWRAERKLGPPVVSGLYHIKGSAETRRGKTGGLELLGPEPLVYRGAGQRAFRDWTMGDLVWVDGVPTGALMLHRSILEVWAAEPDVETYSVPGYPFPMKKVFQRPAQVWTDPDGGIHTASGTSDLYFSHQTLERGLLQKAGYGKWARKRYPYLIDTSPEMCFKHIDRATGFCF